MSPNSFCNSRRSSFKLPDKVISNNAINVIDKSYLFLHEVYDLKSKLIHLLLLTKWLYLQTLSVSLDFVDFYFSVDGVDLFTVIVKL